MAIVNSWIRASVLVAAAALAFDGVAPARSEPPDAPARLLAEAIVVPNARFESLVDYLAGSWAATAPQTHVSFRIRFTRGGEFTFNNHAGRTSVYGRYEEGPGKIRMIIHRTCTDDGRKCAPRNPPTVVSYPLRPISADGYESADERWRRLSRQ